MSALIDMPIRAVEAGLHRFSVDEYERLISLGMISEDENIELLDGYLVKKMGHNPLHAFTVKNIYDLLMSRLPRGWTARSQLPVRLENSEPEPDLAILRGQTKDYRSRHPIAEEVAIVIEVADTTLHSDRNDKFRIYAEANLPEYWIINLTEQIVEVYTKPVSGKYTRSKIYSAEQSITIRFKKIAIQVSVGELLM